MYPINDLVDPYLIMQIWEKTKNIELSQLHINRIKKKSEWESLGFRIAKNWKHKQASGFHYFKIIGNKAWFYFPNFLHPEHLKAIKENKRVNDD